MLVLLATCSTPLDNSRSRRRLAFCHLLHVFHFVLPLHCADGVVPDRITMLFSQRYNFYPASTIVNTTPSSLSVEYLLILQRATADRQSQQQQQRHGKQSAIETRGKEVSTQLNCFNEYTGKKKWGGRNKSALEKQRKRTQLLQTFN